MSSSKPVLYFIAGLVLGLTISIIWSARYEVYELRHKIQAPAANKRGLAGNKFAKSEVNGGSVWHVPVTDDVWNGSRFRGCMGQRFVSRNSTAHLLPGGRERRRVVITCWIMTHLANVAAKLPFVLRTWAADCDHVVLVSKDDLLTATRNISLFDSADILRVNTSSVGRQTLSAQAQAAWQHLHDKYLDVTDFFIRADDDSHFVMPNLRRFLRRMDPDYPIYYGNVMCEPTQQLLFNAGGPGFVLTRAALKKLVEKIRAKDPCHSPGSNDDNKDGMCLRSAGVLPLDMRDDEGKERFMPALLEATLNGKIYEGMHKYWTAHNALRKGMDCCSKKPISFHYVKGEQQLLYYYAFTMRE